jgi:uncharacterized protein YqhQ
LAALVVSIVLSIAVSTIVCVSSALDSAMPVSLDELPHPANKDNAMLKDNRLITNFFFILLFLPYIFNIKTL